MAPATVPTPGPDRHVTCPALPGAVDVLVVGGGASGTSLACHLAAAGWTGTALVVDDGAGPPDAASWAYWSRGDGLLDRWAVGAASRIRVRAPGLDLVLPLDALRYRVMTGPGLRRAADHLLADAPGIRRVRGTVVDVRSSPEGAAVSVALPDGSTTVVRARWVLDSVGPGGSPCPDDVPHLEVLGYRVRYEEACLDPDVPTLMDFRTDQTGGLAFLYVLPTSPTSALVERTRFVVPRSGCAPRPALHEQGLADHLGDVPHHVVGEERALIPLHVRAPAAPAGAIVPIGARAGMVKASTGYGFERIQRHSAQLARSLVRHGHPYAVPGPDRWHRSLDAVLLDVLADDPAAVVGIFSRLFSANAAETVLRFLDEDLSVREELTLFRTLPVGPYARALVRRAGVGMRARLTPRGASAPRGARSAGLVSVSTGPAPRPDEVPGRVLPGVGR